MTKRRVLSRGIKSADVSMKILQVLTRAERPLFLREIAQAAGMQPSNVHRYLSSFLQGGLIIQNPENGKYELGPFAIEMGLCALSQIDGLDLASEGLAELVEELTLDGHITVWGEFGPTVVRWRERRTGVAIRVREGTVIQLDRGAAGRIWSAFLPKPLTRRPIGAALRKMAREQSIPVEQVRESFGKQLESIRKQGYSSSQEERRPNVDAISAPVFDFDGHMAFAITLLGTHGSFDLSGGGEPVHRLCEVSNRVSRRLAGASLEENDEVD